VKRKGFKKLTLSKETILPLVDESLSGAVGMSPGSNTLNCETYLYASCKPQCSVRTCPP
jgi:hypothetical protein